MLEAEVTAALISLGGSCLMGLGAAAYRGGYVGCGGGGGRGSRDRTLRKLRKHRVFTVGEATSRPIVVKFDPVRTKLFQHIQYNIFCKNIQATLRDWLLEVLTFGSDTGDTDISFVGVRGLASSTNVSSELLRKMVESAVYQEQFTALPVQVQALVRRMLDDFYQELTGIFLCTQVEGKGHDDEGRPRRGWCGRGDRGGAYENSPIQLLEQLLDLTHVMMLVTMSKWVTVCDHLNGTLNGVSWGGERIAYVCNGALPDWGSEVRRLWAVLETTGVVDSAYSYMLVRDDGNVVHTGGHLEGVTGFTHADLVGESMRSLQMGLDFESSRANRAPNEHSQAMMGQGRSFTAQFLHFNNVSHSRYEHVVYASPFNHVTHASTDAVYWVLQHRCAALLQKNHTLTSFVVQTTLEGEYALTCCRHVPGRSLTVKAVHFGNTPDRGRPFLGHLQNGMCLTQQLNLNIATMDTLVQSVNGLCGETEFNPEMTNTRSFLHKHDGVQFKATAWVMGEHVLVVHQREGGEEAPRKTSSGGASFLKKYTSNY